MGRKGGIGRKASTIGVGYGVRGDSVFNGGEPVFDVTDRLLEIANGRFEAQPAIVHDLVTAAIGDRFA